MHKRTTTALSASILAAAVAVGNAAAASPATAATPTAWPTYRGDAARTGKSPGTGPAHGPTQLWRVQTQGGIASEPAVVDGVLYIGSDDGTLYALDAATGVDRWRFTTDDPIASSPAVSDGTVYFGSGSGTLYAVDAVTGVERWRFAGARNGTGPAVVDGVVYSGSDNGDLYAIDAASGSRIWAAPLGDNASRSPAVADGVVYIGSADAAIHAVDAATGTERWRFQTDGGVISTPVVANGVVYDCTFDGGANRMYALDAVTGAERWRFETVTGDSVWPPIVDGPDLYTGSSDGNLYALDAATGTERWRLPTGGEIDSSPTLADGIIYLVNQDAQMYAVEATTGHQVWQFAIDAGAEKGPAVADGVAYFGTAFGSIYAIGAGHAGASPSTPPSPEPSMTADTLTSVVIADTPAEKSGDPLWESGGPKLGDSGMGGAASVDPEGNIWVASSYDSVFWIFAPDGRYLESWGTPGTGDGELDLARSDGTGFGDVAFDPDGTFYVADVGNHRIQKFDPDRRFLSAWGSFGGGDGQFVSGNSVATDGQGHVYVGDDMRADVQAFTSEGVFIRSFGRGDGTSSALWRVEVDPLSHDIFASLDAAIGRYDAEGHLLAMIDPPFEYPVNHAFDAKGNLYIAGDFGSVDPDGPDSVVVLDPDAQLLRRIALPASQISVTPDGGTLLVNYYDWDKVQAYSLAQPTSAGLPAPYGPAENGSIVYGKNGDVWVADTGGSNPRALIAGPETDAWPIHSRDGSHILFERRTPGAKPWLMVADADGSDIVPFTEESDEFPWSDWSPDGVHFVAEWAVDGKFVLQVLTTDGSEPVRTLDLGDIEPLDLAGFRPPDGREIIFSGHPKAGAEEFGLYAIGVDGTGLRAIGDVAPGGAFGDMAFSPDGTAVAYWSFEPGVGSGFNLYERDLATGVQRALSLDPVTPGLGFGPRYLPDGTSLVFQTEPHGTTPGADSQLVIAPLDGSTPARAIGPAFADGDRESYDISPDGTTVLFDLAGATWLIDIATGVAAEAPEYMPDQPTWQRR